MLADLLKTLYARNARNSVAAASNRSPKTEEGDLDDENLYNILRQTRYGYTLFNRHDAIVSTALTRYGEYSRGEAEAFQAIVHEGDTVVEAGAHIGIHTLTLARCASATGKVIAFEPQRLVFQTLCANLALNSIVNVDARQVAIGAVDGEIEVPILDPRGNSNFGALEINAAADGKYKLSGEMETVALRTIDGLMLPRCRLIKADVEGMESDVITGARQTIARCRPLLYLENDREASSQALIELIRSLGYNCFWHIPTMFEPDNYLGDPDNVFGGLASGNMLCVPSEAPDTFDLRNMIHVDSATDWIPGRFVVFNAPGT